MHMFCFHDYPKYLNYKTIFIKETRNSPWGETSSLFSSLPRKHASLVQGTRHYVLLHSRLNYIVAVDSRLQISWFLFGAYSKPYRTKSKLSTKPLKMSLPVDGTDRPVGESSNNSKDSANGITTFVKYIV